VDVIPPHRLQEAVPRKEGVREYAAKEGIVDDFVESKESSECP
jgi:hypothetical protein